MLYIIGLRFYIFKSTILTSIDIVWKVTESSGASNESIVSKKQQFSYSEILIITNNFEKVLGEGGFGKVYYGNLNGNKVAVKMLSPSSLQGHRQFHAEAYYSKFIHKS